MEIMLSESLETTGYTCVYALSSVFVLVSVGLVAVQYKMVRKYLHNRKYLWLNDWLMNRFNRLMNY